VALGLKRGILFSFVALALCLTPAFSSLLAQESRPVQEMLLKVGDTVKIDVPQRQDLSRLFTIDGKGNVNLPIIGAVHIEGLGIEDAKGVLLRSLQELYPSTQSISLALVGEKTKRSIFVQGAVDKPGKYDFEGLSTIWDAIKEAGGGTSSASLDAVRLIRVEGGLSTTTVIDVQQALDSGALESLPEPRPGDTIIVPDRNGTFAARGAVNVMGSVLRPASYYLPENKRLADAILAAGGSLDNANLSKVKVLRLLPEGGAVRMEVNFKRYLEKGDISCNPVIRPNDTISIPRSSTVTSPTFILSLVSVTASLISVWLWSTR
jgi:protein involved in polysaccharide export with SLBB domain